MNQELDKKKEGMNVQVQEKLDKTLGYLRKMAGTNLIPIQRKNPMTKQWETIYEPGASLMQLWATKENLKGKILASGKDETQAFAKVAVWKEDSAGKVVAYQEDEIIHIFSQMIQKMKIDAIKNGIEITRGKKEVPEYEFDKNGDIVFKDKAAQLHCSSLLANKVEFAERDAISKAYKRAQKRLLGIEFRNVAEMDAEAEEAITVDEMNTGGEKDTSADDTPDRMWDGKKKEGKK